MSFLLDTCTFLWLAEDSPRLPARVRDALEEENTQTFLSAASAWEIALKFGSPGMQLPSHPVILVPEIRARYGINPLDVEEAAALSVSKLPALHRDPFDRLLIAQAIHHGLILVTPDPEIAQYPVRTLW